MKKTLLKIGVACIALFAAFILAVPTIMHSLGLHPEYTGETHQLPAGKRALIITTSHGVLNAPGETTGEATGIAISELTHPYYSYLDAGMKIDVASIKGESSINVMFIRIHVACTIIYIGSPSSNIKTTIPSVIDTALNGRFIFSLG